VFVILSLYDLLDKLATLLVNFLSGRLTTESDLGPCGLFAWLANKQLL
jgi:hypothetical protein